MMPCPLGEATWIWAPEVNDNRGPGYFVLFRKSFVLDELPKSPCLLFISADTRYRLFVNGVGASFGPCKSYPTRWYYESVDIAPYLQRGLNVVGVRVLRLSPTEPAATSLVRTSKPGMILQCKTSVRDPLMWPGKSRKANCPSVYYLIRDYQSPPTPAGKHAATSRYSSSPIQNGTSV
jgi:hypothetical protein